MDPESLDMKVMTPMGIRVLTSFCAVMMGPTALVVRCFVYALNELIGFST